MSSSIKNDTSSNQQQHINELIAKFEKKCGTSGAMTIVSRNNQMKTIFPLRVLDLSTPDNKNRSSMTRKSHLDDSFTSMTENKSSSLSDRDFVGYRRPDEYLGGKSSLWVGQYKRGNHCVDYDVAQYRREQKLERRRNSHRITIDLSNV